jgi:HIRAN domain
MRQYSIVGQKHCGLDPYLAGTLPGVPVTLVREPMNQYDPNAVMVWINGQHVGYIPSKDAKALAPFIDQTGTDLLLNGESNEVAKAILGMDSALTSAKAIMGVFARSLNSAYPMVSVD